MSSPARPSPSTTSKVPIPEESPIFTVGHGTRSLEEFLELLGGAGVAGVIDVRRFPASRRHPHFTREPLERALLTAGLSYAWEGDALGGRRNRPQGQPTRHPAWRNAAFQAYADYMDTPEFREGLSRLEDAARRDPPVAIMCAETLWWRCHRRLIADALTVDGIEIVHLIGPGATQRHELHGALRVDDRGRPTYDVGVPEKLFP